MNVLLKMTSNLHINKISTYILLLGILLILIIPYFFIDSLFMDGLIYASLSKNLANGVGSFWCPHFSDSSYQRFYEHPPLALGIQSLFYKLMSNSKHVPKIYSLIMFLVIGKTITLIWKRQNKYFFLIPIFIWISIPLVRWSSYSNVLELTLTCFTTLAVLFYIKSKDQNKIVYIFLSGLFIFFGFLSKGFVSLFPLALPFLYWVFIQRNSFWFVLRDFILLLLFTAAPFFLLIYKYQPAKTFFTYYLKNQVMHSISNLVTVDSRLYIVKDILVELMLPIFFLLFILCCLFVKLDRNKFREIFIKDINWSLFFISIGLCASLPVMISMKQTDFYILASYPFYALGIGLFIAPVITKAMNIYKSFKVGKILFFITSFLIFFYGILSNLNNKNEGFKRIELAEKLNNFNYQFTSIKPCRFPFGGLNNDILKVNEVKKITNLLRSNSSVYVNNNLLLDMNLQGYFSFYKNITLTNDSTNVKYFLVHTKIQRPSDHLCLIEAQTTAYKLLKKCDAK